MTMGETVDELILLWVTSRLEEYADPIKYLPVSGL